MAAVFYVVAGALHFIRLEHYLKIMPPYIPWHIVMVRISGACEILGGLGLFANVTRRAAARGLVALLRRPRLRQCSAGAAFHYRFS